MNLRPQRAELLDDLQRLIGVVDKTAFRKFDIYRTLVEVLRFERLPEFAENRLIDQLSRRDINRHAQIDPFITPLGHLTNGIQHDPTS